MENSDETTNTETKKINETEEGPGSKFDIYLQNELVTERLKLLNYEIEFTELGDSLKTIPR
ncbi:unnamed protein product [Meloidogyne enterolobii]|uniref:Uncharacterized protein n=1 Tax=Meloidogyne enterolobii TaxID=390850 RepID=A0ACB1AL23_MELEN